MYPASEWRVVSGRMMMIRAVTNFGVSFRSMLLFASSSLPNLTLMRTLWKILSVVLAVALAGSCLFTLSMYWWPSLPSTPRPAEGRVYPLNNHGHYAYMNESEDRLRRMFWLLFPLLFGGLAAIHHFADPFDAKRRVSRVV